MRLILSGLFVIVVASIKICSSTTIVNYDEYCPEGYNRLAGIPICILVTTNPSSYDNECLKSGYSSTFFYEILLEGFYNLPWKYKTSHSQFNDFYYKLRNYGKVIINYLVANKIEEVWLPIKRGANNFPVFDFPGSMRHNDIKFYLIFSLTEYSNGDCIVYDTISQTIRFEDCNRPYRLMCLINTNEPYIVASEICDSKFIGRLSKYHESCFTINDILVGNRTKIDSNDTFVVVDQLIRQLNMQNETILVYDTLASSPDSSAFKEGSIKIVDKHSVTKQVIQTHHVIIKSPSIDIEFNATSNELIVIVTNYELLWNPTNPEIPFWCNNEFDILADSEIESQYRVIYNSKTSRGFRINLTGNESGIATIWCEGNMLKTFKQIKSNILIVERNVDAYNFVICAKLKQICDGPCRIASELKTFIMAVLDIFKRSQFGYFHVHGVHLKQILSIDQNNINMLLHFVIRYDDTHTSNKIKKFKRVAAHLFREAKITKIRLSNVCENTKDIPLSAKLGQTLLTNIQFKTFKQIKSNILMVEHNLDAENFVFCAKLKWNCDTSCRIAAQMTKLNENVKNILKAPQLVGFNLTEVHVKKILSIDQNNINMLVHFVIGYDDAKTSNRKGRFIIVAAHLLRDIKMTDLRLSNVCKNSNDFSPSAKLGEKVLAKTLCYNSDGFLPTQKCVGNLIEGAHWKEILDTTIFDGCSTSYNNADTVKLFNVNKQLEDLQIHDKAADKITELVVNAIELMNTTLSKAKNTEDTRLVTETLHNIAEIKQINIFDNTTPGEIINPITKFIDKILEFETESLISDGNTMLDTIDQLTTQFANSSASETKQVLDDEGVRIIQTNNLIVVFINPLINNITGIELHRNKPKVENFTDFKIKTLHKNHRIEDTNIESGTLEAMAHITSDAFDKIKITKDNVLVPPDRLIFKFYYKPSLFEEEINDSVHVTPDSKVIGISIPNFSMREYPKGVITMFKTITETTKETETRGCSQNSVKSSSKKGWDIKLWNKKLETKNIVKCEVRRPGNIGFAKLVGVRIRDPEDTPMSQFVEAALNVTTFIGCTLSILGLILIFVTAIFNPAWQKNEATPLILNISTASLFLIVMYYVSEIFSKPQYIKYCPILGSLAQYAVLVGFFVSVIVTNCQYHRYIVIFGNSVPKYLKLQIYLFGWLTPLLLVALCFFLASESYVNLDEDCQTEANGNITIVQTLTCFPTKLTLYVGLHLPIIVIFCYNLSIYVWIIKRVRQETPNLRKTPKKSTVYFQIRLFLYLFFIMSITWIFALLHHYTGFHIFALLFNVTGTMQGCILAIFCILVNQQTRTFWDRKLNKKQHYYCAET